MKKGNLALGKGLKELLPEALKEEKAKSASREELLAELRRVRERIGSLGYSTDEIDHFLEKKDATLGMVRGELKRWRGHLVSLTRLETVLRQMESLKMTSQATAYRSRVNGGENPERVFEEAEKDLKKAVLKRSRRKPPEESVEEVQRIIRETQEDLKRSGMDEEHLEEVKEEAVKKIEELSRSLEELTKLMEPGEEEEIRGGGVEEEDVELKGEEVVSGVEEAAPEEERARRFYDEVERLKGDGFFVGELEQVYDSKGIEEAERELEEFKRRAERMKEIRQKLDSMDLKGFEREASLIRIKLKYPHLLEDVEEDLKRLEELIRKRRGGEEVKSQVAQEESVENLLSRAKKLYIAGDLKGARELFEKVLEVSPDNPTARFMLRRIKMRL